MGCLSCGRLHRRRQDARTARGARGKIAPCWPSGRRAAVRKEPLMKPSSSQAMNLTSDVKFAAIYARVSTEDQGKGFSIPTQIDACHKLAAREGYTVPKGYVLIDEGISGTTMDRPSLRKLRDLVNARAIMAAIVYDPDRLSRNLGHQLLLAEEFERANVKLLIVSHSLVLQRGFTPVGSPVRCGAGDGRETPHDVSAGERSTGQAPTPCPTRVGARPSPIPSRPGALSRLGRFLHRRLRRTTKTCANMTHVR